MIINTIIMIALLMMYYLDVNNDQKCIHDLEKCKMEKQNIIDACMNSSLSP